MLDVIHTGMYCVEQDIFTVSSSTNQYCSYENKFTTNKSLCRKKNYLRFCLWSGVSSLVINLQISNLVHTSSFVYDLHQVRSTSKDWKVNRILKSFGAVKPKVINTIAKIVYLCPRKVNTFFFIKRYII